MEKRGESGEKKRRREGWRIDGTEKMDRKNGRRRNAWAASDRCLHLVVCMRNTYALPRVEEIYDARGPPPAVYVLCRAPPPERVFLSLSVPPGVFSRLRMIYDARSTGPLALLWSAQHTARGRDELAIECASPTGRRPDDVYVS